MKTDKFKKNYHTHTYRCKHASGTIYQYIESAIEKGLTVLGISDHTPLPDNKWPEVRMSMDELNNYNEVLNNAKKDFKDITILKGMECEYSKEYKNFYLDELIGKYKMEYLVGGGHYFPYKNKWFSVYGKGMDKKQLFAYTDYIIESIESKIYLFIAHPDLFGNNYLKWDENTISCSKNILKAAEVYKIPLEINGYAFRKPKIDTPDGKRFLYPLTKFWEIAANYNIEVVINSDAHRPQDIISNMEDAFDISKTFNLKIADFSMLEK